MALVLGDDNKPTPMGFLTKPCAAHLQSVAAIAVAMSATVFAIVTDADGWVTGTKLNSPATADGGFTIGEVAGTITVPRAMRVRAKYFISGITVSTGVTRTAKLFAGAAGTTDVGGISLATDLTGAPSTLQGEAIFECVAGDIISVKAIESAAGTMTVAATGATLIVEEV